MSSFRRADIFDFVHHLATDGTWRVLETRTGNIIHHGLSEDEAIAAALLACANQNSLEDDKAASQTIDLV